MVRRLHCFFILSQMINKCAWQGADSFLLYDWFTDECKFKYFKLAKYSAKSVKERLLIIGYKGSILKSIYQTLERLLTHWMIKRHERKKTTYLLFIGTWQRKQQNALPEATCEIKINGWVGTWSVDSAHIFCPHFFNLIFLALVEAAFLYVEIRTFCFTFAASTQMETRHG